LKILEEARPFSFASTSRLTLCSRQFAIQWLLQTVSQQINQPERDTDLSRPRSLQIYCVELYGSSFPAFSRVSFLGGAETVLLSKCPLCEVLSVNAEYPTYFAFETT